MPGSDTVAALPEPALRAAVAPARSWRDVLRNLGLPANRSRTARDLRRRCDALGIDHCHITGGRRWTDAGLRDAAAACASWPELLAALGYAEVSGSARTTLRAHCLRLGIDVSRLDHDLHAPAVGLVDGDALRRAGSMIVAATLTLGGERVSWPLEPAPYDLVSHGVPGQPRRVQVKTTTQRRRDTWVCSVTRSVYDPENASRRTRRVYDPDEIDDLAIVDGDLLVYRIPYPAVAGRTAIHLSRYGRFLVGAFVSHRGGHVPSPGGSS